MKQTELTNEANRTERTCGRDRNSMKTTSQRTWEHVAVDEAARDAHKWIYSKRHETVKPWRGRLSKSRSHLNVDLAARGLALKHLA